MPHGSGNTSDLSDYAVKLDSLLAKYRAEREKLIDALADIREAIEAVEDARSNILLRYRYIERKTWEEIGQYMGYDSVYVRGTLHSKALKDFQIPT